MFPHPSRSARLSRAAVLCIALAASAAPRGMWQRARRADATPTNPATTVPPSVTASPATNILSATAAPKTDDAGKDHVLAVTAMDDMFMGPTKLPTGLTTIRLHNQGPSPHQLQLLRLNDGVTADHTLAAAKKGGPGALLSMATVAGGPNAVGAGGDQQVTVDLPAGNYLEVCFVPDPDGVSHLAKGMVSALTVAGSPQPATPPASVATARMSDFKFTLPSPFHGHGTLQVINDGPQPHELTVLALAPGKTVGDATAFLTEATHSGPPPFADAGGLGAIGAGSDGVGRSRPGAW